MATYRWGASQKVCPRGRAAAARAADVRFWVGRVVGSELSLSGQHHLSRMAERSDLPELFLHGDVRRPPGFGVVVGGSLSGFRRNALEKRA